MSPMLTGLPAWLILSKDSCRSTEFVRDIRLELVDVLHNACTSDPGSFVKTSKPLSSGLVLNGRAKGMFRPVNVNVDAH